MFWFHRKTLVKYVCSQYQIIHYILYHVQGDLVNDEIDIAVASLTITSEREEVVDFITPYFDQSGISIAGRKPVRPRSLFKFLEVLHVEVGKLLPCIQDFSG